MMQQARCQHHHHRHSRAARQRSYKPVVIVAAKPWRPTQDDVERLGRGEGARRRGTGSFHIPHRLAAGERPVYDAAKDKGFLAVRGSGVRSAHAKRAHPLPNLFRQLCDARGAPCIVIEKATSGLGSSSGSDGSGSGNDGEASDVVVVDLAPLRRLDTAAAAARVCALAEGLGLRRVPADERGADQVPFDVAPLPMPPPPTTDGASSRQQQQQQQHGGITEADVAAAAAAVEEQAAHVRALKERGGRPNGDPEVQAGVQQLLGLKARLAELEGRLEQQQQQSQQDQEQQQDEGDSDSAGKATSSKRREVLPDDHPYATAAVWQLAPQPLFFAGGRGAAKEFAASLAAEARSPKWPDSAAAARR